MIKLHGFAVSNYFNMVKLALLEKGVAFEINEVFPSQEPEFLAISPRGKVPALETRDGFISETSVILEYIEDTQGGKALLPDNPFERATVRALTKEIELYIELAGRSCYPEVYFGGQVDQAIKDKARTELLGGVEAVKRHGRFAPYVAGSEMTIADIVFLYSIDLANGVAKKLFSTDLLEDWPEAADLLKKLKAMPNVQKVAADRDAGMAEFMAARGKR